MFNRVLKYDLTEADGPFTVNLPTGAKILFVGEQGDTAKMWVEGDIEAPLEQRYFVCI